MFIDKSWISNGWYVRLEELHKVFTGFFTSGGDWAEIWAINTPLTILNDKTLFRDTYIRTIFGRLNTRIACVKLVLSVDSYNEFVKEIKEDGSLIQENMKRLSHYIPGALSRIYVRSIQGVSELPIQPDSILGFCAVGRCLDYEMGPLFFYRTNGPELMKDDKAKKQKLMVVGARLRTGGAFSANQKLFEDIFIRETDSFVKASTLIGENEPDNHMDLFSENPREIRLLLVVALEEEAKLIVEQFNSTRAPNDMNKIVDLKEVRRGGRSYYEGSVISNRKDIIYHIFLIACGDMGSVNAAVATSIGGVEFRPDYVVLLGIAGGRYEQFDKDRFKKMAIDGDITGEVDKQDSGQISESTKTELGHVVYGKGYTAYEYKKWEERTMSTGKRMIKCRRRPRHFNSNDNLSKMASDLDSGGKWKGNVVVKVPNGDSTKNRTLGALPGHILSGSKVIASSNLFKQIKVAQDDVVALEMEAEGVWKASEWIDAGFITIKGISDWADPLKGGKDDEMSRAFAAKASAKFLFDALKKGLLLPKI